MGDLESMYDKKLSNILDATKCGAQITYLSTDHNERASSRYF